MGWCVDVWMVEVTGGLKEWLWRRIMELIRDIRAEVLTKNAKLSFVAGAQCQRSNEGES
jgi:hypothetical protein